MRKGERAVTRYARYRQPRQRCLKIKTMQHFHYLKKRVGVADFIWVKSWLAGLEEKDLIHTGLIVYLHRLEKQRNSLQNVILSIQWGVSATCCYLSLAVTNFCQRWDHVKLAQCGFYRLNNLGQSDDQGRMWMSLAVWFSSPDLIKLHDMSVILYPWKDNARVTDAWIPFSVVWQIPLWQLVWKWSRSTDVVLSRKLGGRRGGGALMGCSVRISSKEPTLIEQSECSFGCCTIAALRVSTVGGSVQGQSFSGRSSWRPLEKVERGCEGGSRTSPTHCSERDATAGAGGRGKGACYSVCFCRACACVCVHDCVPMDCVYSCRPIRL